MARSSRLTRIRIVQCCPKLRRTSRCKLKFPGKDTDDGIADVTQRDGLSEDIPIPSKALLPCGEAQQYSAWRRWSVIFCREVPSQDWSHSKCAKESATDT